MYLCKALALGGALLTLVLHAAGCTCEMPPDPPSGGDGGGFQQITLSNGVIDHRYDSITIAPGDAVDFRGKAFCAPESRPCTYRWDFGNGQTSTQLNPGKIVFPCAAPPCFHVVTFTVADAKNTVDPTPSRAYVAVWNGEFKDSFDQPGRKGVENDKYGWRTPVLYDEVPLFSIEQGWLKERGDWTLPGSTAMMAWPLVRDAHVEVVQRRSQQSEGDHYSDIVMRMHPSGGVGQFYRVRIWQQGTADNGLEIAIFKISDAADQHGILISDPTQPASTRPTQCKQCPYVAGYPRNKDIRIVVELRDRFFQARLEDPAKPGVPVLSAAAEDPLDPPYLYDGLIGLTHFLGVSYFKHFVLRRIDKLTNWDGSVPPG